MLENKVADKIFENTKDMNNKEPYINKYKKYLLQKKSNRNKSDLSFFYIIFELEYNFL
jgi:hypothetical protein